MCRLFVPKAPPIRSRGRGRENSQGGCCVPAYPPARAHLQSRGDRQGRRLSVLGARTGKARGADYALRTG
jgi:hypothetical protein